MIHPNYIQSELNQVEILLQKDELKPAQDILAVLLSQNADCAEIYKYYGWIAFKQVKLEQAQKYFLKAYNLDLKNPDYTYNLGWIYFYQNNLKQAEEYYLKTIDLAPDFHLPYINMGAIKYESGLYLEALEYYNKAITLSPLDTHLINNTGDVYTKLKQYPEAIQTYNKVISLDPENARAYGNLASVYLYMHDTIKAEELCLKALEINPESINGHYNLASIFVEQNRYEEALEEILKAKGLSKRPMEPVLKSLLYIKEKLGQDTSNEHYFLDQIQNKDPLIEHIINNNHYKVLDILLVRLKTDSENFYYLSQLAYTLSQLGRYTKAVDVYKYCLLLNDTDYWVCQHYALALSRINKKTEAISYYKRAIEINPDLTWARKQLAELYLELNVYDKAEELINKTIEITTENETGLLSNLFSLKAKALELKTPEQALDWYMLAVRYNEWESYNYERIASILAISYTEVVSELQTVDTYINSIADDRTINYCQRAIGEFRLGNIKKSIKLYKYAIDENIMYYPAYAGISQAMYENKYGSIQLELSDSYDPLLEHYITNWKALTPLEREIISLSIRPYNEKLKWLVHHNYSVTIVPIDTKLTAYNENQHLNGISYLDGTLYDGIRATGGNKAYIGIERVRDLLWIIPDWLLQAPATVAHEFAHQVYNTITDKIISTIENDYKNTINMTHPLVTDYAGTNKEEFFAENYCQLVRNQIHKPEIPLNINFLEKI